MGDVILPDVASHQRFKQSEEATKFRPRERSDLRATIDGLKKETSFGFG
jgi:hypothetical protein